jgi:hypothetical protein
MDIEGIEDLAPSDEQAELVAGGSLASLVAQSPLTLGLGQQINIDLGNGPLLGGHANVGL